MSETFSKKELIDKMADELDITKKASREYIEYILEEIGDQLAKGNTVDLFGFGKFSVNHKEAHEAFNPRTREAVTVEARNTITYKASTALKEKINK